MVVCATPGRFPPRTIGAKAERTTTGTKGEGPRLVPWQGRRPCRLRAGGPARRLGFPDPSSEPLSPRWPWWPGPCGRLHPGLRPQRRGCPLPRGRRRRVWPCLRRVGAPAFPGLGATRIEASRGRGSPRHRGSRVAPLRPLDQAQRPQPGPALRKPTGAPVGTRLADVHSPEVERFEPEQSGMLKPAKPVTKSRASRDTA